MILVLFYKLPQCFTNYLFTSHGTHKVDIIRSGSYSDKVQKKTNRYQISAPQVYHYIIINCVVQQCLPFSEDHLAQVFHRRIRFINRTKVKVVVLIRYNRLLGVQSVYVQFNFCLNTRE